MINLQNNPKKIARLSLISALALITFTAENLLPPLLFFAPGTKIGLASVFVTLAFILYGKTEAIIVLFIKCILGAVFSGNIFTLYYSVPAGLVSLIITIILYNTVYPKIGVIAVSIIAAIFHNIVQIIMAAILIKTFMILSYILIVAIAGVIAGIITGVCLYFMIKYIPQKYLV